VSDPAAPALVGAAPPSGPAGFDPHQAYETRLAREILVSERFRATLLAVLPTIAMLVFLAVSSASPDTVAWMLRGKFDRTPVGLFLCAVAGFEFYVLHSTERMLRDGDRPSALRRYGYALVETSIPTVVIVYYGTLIGPVQALLLPSAFVYFVFILLSTLRLDFALCAFTGLVAALEYAAIALFWVPEDTAVAEPGLTSLPPYLAKAAILLVAGVAGGFVAARLRRSFRRAIESLEEHAHVLNVFGQHVSPEVVQRLVATETQATSELRDVCVMFLDIRNFTAFAEKRTPAEVVEYLNAVFEVAVSAVVEHRGIVNKFLGDGFMAVFGAPSQDENPCRSAIDAGLAVIDRIDALVSSGRIPATRVGLGLHAGPAVVGNIGSARRKEYTVIGDVVNVASRVEALNKELGARMLVTEHVWNVAGKDEVKALSREKLRIRGREAYVEIFQLA
jgi:adenylate cyclase